MLRYKTALLRWLGRGGRAACCVALSALAAPWLAPAFAACPKVEGPRDLEPFENYALVLTPINRSPVLEMSGVLEDPYASPFKSHGRIRVTPRLCNGDYRLRFTTTSVSGHLDATTYATRISAAKLGGQKVKCPFARLRSDNLATVSGTLKLVCDDFRIVSFKATPIRRNLRAGGLFDGLSSRLAFDTTDLPQASAILGITINYRRGPKRRITMGVCFTPGTKIKPCR